MKLSELEPQFLRLDAEDENVNHYVDTLATAHGLMFLCPACFAANGGAVGTHSILAWFRDRGVPEHVTPGPGRWPASGTDYADLTLDGSILLTSGCKWHGYVSNGGIRTV